MSKPLARLGDPINHGGAIISGSPTATCDGKSVARVGDKVACSVHGQQVIISGSSTNYVDDVPVAHVGSKISCGAEVVAGSPTRFVDA